MGIKSLLVGLALLGPLNMAMAEELRIGSRIALKEDGLVLGCPSIELSDRMTDLYTWKDRKSLRAFVDKYCFELTGTLTIDNMTRRDSTMWYCLRQEGKPDCYWVIDIELKLER